MRAMGVQLLGGLLCVGGEEVRVRRSLPLRYRGTIHWMRNADGLGSVLTRGILATSALWSSVTWAPDALAAIEDLSLASLLAAVSPSASLTTLGGVVTMAVLVWAAVSDDAVPTPAIDRVEVDGDDRELTIVHERDGRWFSGSRERTLRPVSDDALAEATASFRARGVEVERDGD